MTSQAQHAIDALLADRERSRQEVRKLGTDALVRALFHSTEHPRQYRPEYRRALVREAAVRLRAANATPTITSLED